MKMRKPFETEESEVEIKPKAKKVMANPLDKYSDAELIAMYHKAVNRKEPDVATGAEVAGELLNARGYDIIEHDEKKDEFVKKVA